MLSVSPDKQSLLHTQLNAAPGQVSPTASLESLRASPLTQINSLLKTNLQAQGHGDLKFSALNEPPVSSHLERVYEPSSFISLIDLKLAGDDPIEKRSPNQLRSAIMDAQVVENNRIALQTAIVMVIAESASTTPLEFNQDIPDKTYSVTQEAARISRFVQHNPIDETTGRWLNTSGLKVKPVEIWSYMSLDKHRLMRVSPMYTTRFYGKQITGKIYADNLDYANDASKKVLKLAQDSAIHGQASASAAGYKASNSSNAQLTASGPKSNFKPVPNRHAHNLSDAPEIDKTEHEMHFGDQKNIFEFAFRALISAAQHKKNNQIKLKSLEAGMARLMEETAAVQNSSTGEPKVAASLGEVKNNLAMIKNTTKALQAEVRPALVEWSSDEVSESYVTQCSFEDNGALDLILPDTVLDQYGDNLPDLLKKEQCLVFIQDLDGNVKTTRHKDTHYHHSTPNGGRPVRTAGEMFGYFHSQDDGAIVFRAERIRNKSGHYWPKLDTLAHFFNDLLASGFNPKTVEFEAVTQNKDLQQLVSGWSQLEGEAVIPENDKSNGPFLRNIEAFKSAIQPRLGAQPQTSLYHRAA